MKKRILNLIIINVLVLFIVTMFQPQCEPCVEGFDCPLCISNMQIITLLSLFVFDVFYFFKFFLKRKYPPASASVTLVPVTVKKKLGINMKQRKRDFKTK